MDTIDKLRILRFMIYEAVADWRKQVWSRDLDEHYCCDGTMCGCGAMTIRELWMPYVKMRHLREDGDDR